jgi:hypothetical protein
MKQILTAKKWLIPFIAVCFLTACDKHNLVLDNPFANMNLRLDSSGDKLSFNNGVINSIPGTDTLRFSGDGGHSVNAR